MKKNRIKACWLLLMVLLYAAGAVLSVGEAQARYVITATWNTVVTQQEEEKKGVTSDCLEEVPEADDFMILLGTMTQESYAVTFTLSAEEATSGTLEWKLDQPDYISVEMRMGENLITQSAAIEIPAGDTVVTMILTPTENAFTDAREAVNVSVAVTWANTLRGTFLTQLPAVEEEEEPTEETEPPTEETEPPASDPTEPVPTEPTPTEPTPTEPTPTEPTPTEPTPTNPTEPTKLDPTEETQPNPGTGISGLTIHNESSGDETVPEEEETQPVSETEPVTSDEPDGQAEEGDDPSNPQTPGEGNDGSDDSSDSSEETTEDPTEPAQDETPTMTIQLETTGAVNPVEALPIQIKAPQNGGAVRLGIATVTESEDPEREPQTGLRGFPKYTRYSMSDGATCYMLYTENTISLNVADGGITSVVLDLSRVDLSGVELEQFQMILGAIPHSAAGEIATCVTTVIPESVRNVTLSSRVLTVGTPLEIEVSDYWKAYSLQYSLEMLTEDENTGTVAYVPVTLPEEDCLTAEVVSDESGTRIIFSIGKMLPPAGTYRVSLNWKSEDTCYAQTQEIFFINYLAYTEYEETGGAEQ